jgi:hypothetical protein
MVAPGTYINVPGSTYILLYGSEVWGIENVNIIDQFQLKFHKLILNLKQSTPNCMLYGLLGILPLSIHIKSRAFGIRLLVANKN